MAAGYVFPEKKCDNCFYFRNIEIDGNDEYLSVCCKGLFDLGKVMKVNKVDPNTVCDSYKLYIIDKDESSMYESKMISTYINTCNPHYNRPIIHSLNRHGEDIYYEVNSEGKKSRVSKSYAFNHMKISNNKNKEKD